ncbi:MAG: SDR family oxidoreductase [Pseudomonadota bacterium]
MTRPIVLITGASRGIGAAAARLFAANGFDVALNYQASEDAAAAVAETVTRAGARALLVAADVASPDDVARMFERVDGELGTLDVLVNNAGITGPRCRIDELSHADLERVLAINVTGSVLCAQQAIKRMSTRHGGQGGAIINISSGSAYIGNAGRGVHYAISKGALNSFNIGASQELVAEGIRVNAVSPGMTATDMTSDTAPGTFANLPMGRAAQPEEIAEAILWLALDKASYVAGANIRVGGGRP